MNDTPARLPRWVLVLIGAVSLLRLIVAARIPLTADEAYYWSWSRHLDAAYTDHPPAVAWLIAATAELGRSPAVVRLPFVLCEAATAAVLGQTALALGGSAAAGAAAALAFTLIPQVKLALGEALPDGPFALCWALSLWCAVRLEQRPTRGRALALGLAAGGTILSRFFGWALIAGLVAYVAAPARRQVRGPVAGALAVAVLVYAPFLLADARHGWQNLAFTLFRRAALHGPALTAGAGASSLRFIVFALLFWLVAGFVVLRPRRALLAWTALPLPTVLAVLGLFETVESYWLLGPLVSLCVGIGLSVGRMASVPRIALGIAAAIPAGATFATAAFAALDEPVQAAALHALGPGGKGALYSSVFMFAPLAADVAARTAANRAEVLTDRLEIAGELLYFGVPSTMVGTAPQVAQWDRWYDPEDRSAPRALLVTFSPVPPGSPLDARLRARYAVVRPGEARTYAFAGTPAGTFTFTWCEAPRPGSARP